MLLLAWTGMGGFLIFSILCLITQSDRLGTMAFLSMAVWIVSGVAAIRQRRC